MTEFERNKLIKNLLAKYNFLNHGVIGKSHCERNIEFLSLGNFENSILWACAFHGMEWLTSLVILKFLENICNRIKSKNKILGIDIEKNLKNRGLVIIPCVNPDGVEISLTGYKSAKNFQNLVKKASNNRTFSWQANAAGVDINHNFDAGWNELKKLETENKILEPSPTRFGGTKPESEPETRALVNFCKKNKFSYAIAFHSQGEEIYWKYGKSIPENSYKLAKIFSITSGYKLSSPEGLAVGGGFKDWFIKEFNKPAFTIEMGMGKNPLPISNLCPIYNKIYKMLLSSLLI